MLVETRGGDLDEFGDIERLFRPLTRGATEARDLLDDVCVVAPRRDCDLVITTDSIVEGVHFLASDPPETVGRKLLRVNLSDLAAKGAEPIGWFLNVAWPHSLVADARASFAAGLAIDQDAWALPLFGGDTVATPGPWTLSATVLGYAPAGRTPSRATARPYDILFVSGVIGDGGLGLEASRTPEAFGDDASALIARYRLPEPRLLLRNVVRRYARASCDISDGLFADAGRIAAASGCAVELTLEHVPLSAEGSRHLDRLKDRGLGLVQLATFGDDYELALAVSPQDAPDAVAQAVSAGVELTRVGVFKPGRGVSAIYRHRPIALERLGWTHR